MSGAVLPVLLAIGVCACVFLAAWWLLGKLQLLRLPMLAYIGKSQTKSPCTISASRRLELSR
jgi:hypothetical protein